MTIGEIENAVQRMKAALTVFETRERCQACGLFTDVISVGRPGGSRPPP